MPTFRPARSMDLNFGKGGVVLDFNNDSNELATSSAQHADALFVAADALFVSRRGQFATLTARDRIPATYPSNDFVAGGGLMSYGADILEMFHGVGVYTGKVLHGAKPADMPVQQTTKFEFTINLQTARALGIEIPSGLLAIADEVVE